MKLLQVLHEIVLLYHAHCRLYLHSAPPDYTPLSDTFTVSGSEIFYVTLYTSVDNEIEGNETLSLSLTSDSTASAPDTANVTITDGSK